MSGSWAECLSGAVKKMLRVRFITVAAFKATYGAKFGKAVAKISDDFDELLALYDFPPYIGSTCGLRTTSGCWIKGSVRGVASPTDAQGGQP